MISVIWPSPCTVEVTLFYSVVICKEMKCLVFVVHEWKIYSVNIQCKSLWETTCFGIRRKNIREHPTTDLVNYLWSSRRPGAHGIAAVWNRMVSPLESSVSTKSNILSFVLSIDVYMFFVQPVSFFYSRGWLVLHNMMITETDNNWLYRFESKLSRNYILRRIAGRVWTKSPYNCIIAPQTNCRLLRLSLKVMFSDSS